MTQKFVDRLRMRTKLLRHGAEYTFTRISEADPINTPEHPNPDAAIDAAYKTKVPTETTFKEYAKVDPARAYDVHSNVLIVRDEGGNDELGIITVQVLYATAVVEDDIITTEDGKYKLVAKESYSNEFKLFEGHKM